jgi:hypothetical protein
MAGHIHVEGPERAKRVEGQPSLAGFAGGPGFDPFSPLNPRQILQTYLEMRTG